MGLITNGHRNAFSPFRWMNGALISIYNGGPALRNGYLPGKLHNWSYNGERQTALPNGNLHPYSWMLPRTGGGMSMRTIGSGSMSSNLIPTVNGAIDFTGQGTLSAEAALVISMFCDMVGSGSLEANIVGLLDMAIDLEGSGDLEASLSGIANMLIDLQGSGDLEATIAAYGNMAIDIVVTGTGLTTENVGQAVFATLASQINIPGTAGEALLNAGSSGNPWDTIIESGYTAEEILKLIASVLTGKVSGAGTGTETFRDINDTKNRVTATVDSNGNRTAITLDAT